MTVVFAVAAEHGKPLTSHTVPIRLNSKLAILLDLIAVPNRCN
jgi:hypothetical protein